MTTLYLPLSKERRQRTGGRGGRRGIGRESIAIPLPTNMAGEGGLWEEGERRQVEQGRQWKGDSRYRRLIWRRQSRGRQEEMYEIYQKEKKNGRVAHWRDSIHASLSVPEKKEAENNVASNLLSRDMVGEASSWRGSDLMLGRGGRTSEWRKDRRLGRGEEERLLISDLEQPQ